ncbi:hypothetical protein Fuma_01430 [Fuerstiella marisgermanici]|uniref:Uncharacterized protein n=1 Tax=Fuerstiella marisgermanici TaxID=1891926 RepID=A0A1P8WCR4_9PLAN|nr:hypothetical protein Fuma_01430 [Fuerstiella marisgermanici]
MPGRSQTEVVQEIPADCEHEALAYPSRGLRLFCKRSPYLTSRCEQVGIRTLAALGYDGLAAAFLLQVPGD